MLSSFNKIIAKLLVCCVAIVSLAACSESDPPVSDKNGPEKPKIALIMKSLANEFFVKMAEGAREHNAANAETYDLIVNGIRNETDLSGQAALVDQMVAAGVDAIVIAPADSKALIPALRRAMNSGVVVVNIDNRLDKDILADLDLQIPFVGPNNEAGAYQASAILAQQLSPDAEVAILGGVPTAFNAQQREAGMRRAIAEVGLDLVASQSADWDQTKAAEVTSALISKYPNLEAIFAANDSMAMGAVAAIQQVEGASTIKVVGFDNIGAIQQLLLDGIVVATVDQHGDQLAVYGLQHAIGLLAGEPQQDVNTPVDVITGGTAVIRNR